MNSENTGLQLLSVARRRFMRLNQLCLCVHRASHFLKCVMCVMWNSFFLRFRVHTSKLSRIGTVLVGLSFCIHLGVPVLATAWPARHDVVIGSIQTIIYKKTKTA